MATLAQIDANRANAQLSTGPRTEEGKSISAQNARKSGFYSPVADVAPDHRADYEALRDALFADVRPVGALENEFFGRLVVTSWHLRLVTAYESEVLAGPEDPFEPGAKAAEKLLRIQRYRRDLERARRHALAELRRLQTDRARLLLSPPPLVEKVRAAAPLAEFTRPPRESARPASNLIDLEAYRRATPPPPDLNPQSA